MIQMLRRILLRWALRTIHLKISPSTGVATIMLNDKPVPKGVKCFIKWPGRPGVWP
jgi:hypothetical protein